jgi:hypothetical protein
VLVLRSMGVLNVENIAHINTRETKSSKGNFDSSQKCYWKDDRYKQFEPSLVCTPLVFHYCLGSDYTVTHLTWLLN